MGINSPDLGLLSFWCGQKKSKFIFCIYVEFTLDLPQGPVSLLLAAILFS